MTTAKIASSVTLTTPTLSGDTTAGTINGLTVGKGGGAVSTNTAVGASALAGANSGSGNNTAVGYQAGYSNTTGVRNVFVGQGAGYSMVTNSENTFVGRNAGNLATGGTNTFVGEEAGASATTGTLNSFFGTYAGSAVTSGSKNTIIGAYSGNQNGLDSRTATNAIILSDGDGNPKGYFGGSAYGEFTLNSSASQAYNGILNFAEAGTNKVQQYYQKNVTSFYVTNNSSGGVYLGSGSTAWASASDERLKDIIEPIENGLTKVTSLRAVIGKYKTDAESTRRSFLIAQDVQAVLPEAISTTMVKDDETNTEYLGVSYTDVIPLLVASIKELKTIVDAQAAEIAELKAKVA